MEYSVIHRYQKKLEEGRDFVKEEEGKTIYQEEKKKNNARESSQVAQSIRNVFIRCQATTKVKSLSFAANNSHMTPQQQLDFYLDVIYSRIVDLVEITKEFDADEPRSSILEEKSLLSANTSTGNLLPTSTGAALEGFAKN